MKRWPPFRSWIATTTIALCASCATIPVGVQRLAPREVHRDLTANALTAGAPSWATRNVLFENNLTTRFDTEPAEALGRLHEHALSEGHDADFYALAELSFLEGERTRDRAWQFASALYAWAFLFEGERREPLDPRVRVATDLYNRALTRALTAAEGQIELRGGTFALPFGELEASFDERSLDWYGRRLQQFIPVAELAVRGLQGRFRDSGIGAPLAADASATDPERSTDFLPRRLKVPVTAILRPQDVRRQLRMHRVGATLELHSDPDRDSVEIGGRRVPLEREHTATVAAMLADAPIWEMELEAFFGAMSGGLEKGQLVALRPHVEGRSPVVFVHGTNSNPGRWAEMVNVLDNDPRLRTRFEPWLFFYNSGNPIIYSSYLLRRALSEAVAGLDPAIDDACLRDMVVVGHSQGGLLTKITVVDSGEVFWSSISKRPFDELNMNEADKAMVRDIAFVEPLPFVRRVVFIATPHRGSFLAASGIVRRIILALVSLPSRITDLTTHMLTANPDTFMTDDFASVTAVDNMSPSHRFIRNISSLPIAPGVAAHSIIAVKGDGPIEGGDDGVVEYASAHITGVESEKIVRSPHSMQAHPETIEEVRRVLLVHAAKSACRHE